MKAIVKHSEEDGETTIFLSGSLVGYAYLKARQNPTYEAMMRIARCLSDVNPEIKIEPSDLDFLKEKTYANVCYDCFYRKKKEWSPAGDTFLKTCLLFSHEDHAKRLEALRERICVKLNPTVKNSIDLDVRKYLYTPVNPTLIPDVPDTTLHFVKFPEVVYVDGTVCGLALSMATHEVEDSEDLIDRKYFFSAFLRALENNWLVVVGVLDECLNHFRKLLAERNKILFNRPPR